VRSDPATVVLKGWWGLKHKTMRCLVPRDSRDGLAVYRSREAARARCMPWEMVVRVTLTVAEEE
jgi:hypothetical protein